MDWITNVLLTGGLSPLNTLLLIVLFVRIAKDIKQTEYRVNKLWIDYLKRGGDP